MMGPRQRHHPKLFYVGFDLERRIRLDHPFRRILSVVDFDFVRPMVQDHYGLRGHVSVDPVVLLKLMFLLFYEQVPSERALMERLPERLDWLWFLGYDLDDPVPDHSVLSKARRRWGREVFSELFARVLDQCVSAGLVDGSLVHVDASVIAANADKRSTPAVLRRVGEQFYQQLEEIPQGMKGENRLPTTPTNSLGKSHLEPEQASQAALGRRISPTDPEARLTHKNGQVILGYKDHRVIDDRYGIITATVTTDAGTAEAHVLGELIDQHQGRTGQWVETVVADKGYGTAENYDLCHARGITPCIPHQRHLRDLEKFPPDAFRYEAQGDCYRCPAGQTLSFVATWQGRRTYRADPGVCPNCPLKSQCTSNPNGRRITRHGQRDRIDWADQCLPLEQRRRLLQRRAIRAEGSFADATNRHGFKRARWRRLVHMTIQNLLIAAIQNLRKLLKYGERRRSTKCACLMGAIHDTVGLLFWAVKPDPSALGLT